MFDWKKPTVQLLGRWQPWHDGHQELFKRALKENWASSYSSKRCKGSICGNGP